MSPVGRILIWVGLAALLIHRIKPVVQSALTNPKARRLLLVALIAAPTAYWAAHAIDLAAAGIHPERLRTAQAVLAIAGLGFLGGLWSAAWISAPAIRMPPEVATYLDDVQKTVLASPTFFEKWSVADLKNMRSLVLQTPDDAPAYGELLRRLDAALASKRD